MLSKAKISLATVSTWLEEWESVSFMRMPLKLFFFMINYKTTIFYLIKKDLPKISLVKVTYNYPFPLIIYKKEIFLNSVMQELKIKSIFC